MAVAEREPACGVDHDVSRGEKRGNRDTRAPAECAYPRDQFAERERFGQIVVRAQRETGDAVGDRARGRQHQDAHGAAGEPAADFVVQGADIHGVPGLVNLYGIESPGLTGSLPLADEVVRKLCCAKS